MESGILSRNTLNLSKLIQPMETFTHEETKSKQWEANGPRVPSCLSVVHLQELCQNHHNQNASHHLPKHHGRNLCSHHQQSNTHTQKISHARPTARISVPGFKPQSAETHQMSTPFISTEREDCAALGVRTHTAFHLLILLWGAVLFSERFPLCTAVQPQTHYFPVHLLYYVWVV